MKKLFILGVLLFSLMSCTENSMSRTYGGDQTIYIENDQKFVNVTWKESDLWYLTKKRQPTDTIKEVYMFTEKSKYGLMEGTVVFVEK